MRVKIPITIKIRGGVVSRVVERAIARSISHTEVVRIPEEDYKPAVQLELMAECDDSVSITAGYEREPSGVLEHGEFGRLHEFWGRTDDGDWRVHLECGDEGEVAS